MQLKVISIRHFWYSVIKSENSDQKGIVKSRRLCGFQSPCWWCVRVKFWCRIFFSSLHCYASPCFRDISVYISLWNVMKFPKDEFVCICLFQECLRSSQRANVDAQTQMWSWKWQREEGHLADSGPGRGAGKASRSRSMRQSNQQCEERCLLVEQYRVRKLIAPSMPRRMEMSEMTLFWPETCRWDPHVPESGSPDGALDDEPSPPQRWKHSRDSPNGNEKFEQRKWLSNSPKTMTSEEEKDRLLKQQVHLPRGRGTTQAG